MPHLNPTRETEIRDKWREECPLVANNFSYVDDWWLQVLAQEVDKAVKEERAKLLSFEPIKHIHANFDSNGLVKETADKFNEIIDAINKLQALSPTELYDTTPGGVGLDGTRRPNYEIKN